MEKPYPQGSILIDAPPHESTETLVDYAHDFDQWSIWTNVILDPEHAWSNKFKLLPPYYRQDQDRKDRGPQERKKKAKTHLPSKGCARHARAQE